MKLIDRLWGHIVLLCVASGLIGVIIGAHVLTNPIADNWIYRWQTLIAGTFTIIAAAVAWIAVQRQLRQTERHKVEEEIGKLNQLVAYFEALQSELKTANERLAKGREQFFKPTDQFETRLHGAQSTQIPLPHFVENAISLEARMSLDALNDYRRAFERLMDRKIEECGAALLPAHFFESEIELGKRITWGCVSQYNNLKNDIAKIDIPRTELRLKTLTERLKKIS